MDDEIAELTDEVGFPISVAVGHLSKLEDEGVDTFVLLELIYENATIHVAFSAQDALVVSQALTEAACMLGVSGE